MSVLGNFLGFGVNAPRRAASFEFYRSLGFEPTSVGDADAGPYAALSDGTVTIGLHDAPERSAADPVAGAVPVPTFVRPDLQSYVRAYRRLGIELEVERLASDEFNEIAFSDPSGQPVRVLEARTFSAAPERRNVCACGTFLELAVAVGATGPSQTFWEALGLKPTEKGAEHDGWIRLAGHGLTLGLYSGVRFATGLAFRAPNLAARTEYLEAKGLSVRAGPRLAGRDCALLVAPEGTALYLLDA